MSALTMEAIKPVLHELERTGRARLTGVSTNARPWLAASLVRAGVAPLLWVTCSEPAAEDAYHSARFFLGDSERDPSDPFAAQVVQFPLHQSLPYDELSPDRLLVADRLSLLFRLTHGPAPKLLIASVPALMRTTMPRTAIDRASMLILEGQVLDRKELAKKLLQTGYLNVPLVEDPGSFAIRGGILDLYTPLLPLPVRIELLGDEVESIRTFDPSTQRTVSRLDTLFLGPVREIIQDEESSLRALEVIERLADRLDLPSHLLLGYRRSLKEGVWFFGIETLMPAFHSSVESLFDFLGQNTRLLLDDPGTIQVTAEEAWRKAITAHAELVSSGDLAFPPDSVLLPPEVLRHKMGNYHQISVGLSEGVDPPIELITEDVRGLRRQIVGASAQEEPIAPLVDLIECWQGLAKHVVLVASSLSRARELSNMLRRRGVPIQLEPGKYQPEWTERPTPSPRARIVLGELPGGFLCKAAGVGFVPDTEVFGRPERRSRPRPSTAKVAALKPGNIVVHMDFGIGRFVELTKLEAGGAEGDYLLLQYRGGDRLYLPVTRMNLIDRYKGSDDGPVVLSRLGGKGWERTKRQVQQSLLEMAGALVGLHAARRAKPGLVADPPGEEYHALEASFHHEETEDQHRAIQEVIADITHPRVMDRLICGDVGFGKTEIAIRAAYLNVLSGRQTAVLVPTTILALQHLATFRSRLAQRAVRVEMASRLVKPSDLKAILTDLTEGKVDVIIGTHRLLRDDVVFKSIGLVVIDEEHRFGVRHKERLKQIRKNVDTLTMTATPIPRTLEMSLTGLRDISVIQTPPAGRRSIRTLITRFSKRVIAEAIRLELQRGGQVFFLHNWVRSLPAMEKFINKLVPEARTGIAHGRMGENKIERVMVDFVNREINVLICTSIIESGLDIPTANTIIVNRSDLFGLSQLHQIRGRVGRASERAYAYFLIPGISSISHDARKRLEVVSNFTEPGSGYQVATHDLEIRGAGNLLGKDQSGHIAAVGFELYNQFLERALMEIRGQTLSEGLEPEISLPVASFIPENFIPDQQQRIEIYARLSRTTGEEDLFEIKQEIIDRFGPEPPEVENLCELIALKTQARRARVFSLEVNAGCMNLRLDTSSSIDLGGLVRLAKEQAEVVSIDPEGWLRLHLNPEQRKNPLPVARWLLTKLLSLKGTPPPI